VKTISVGQLRQNPTAALDALERGEEFEITRHRKVIGRLVPAQPIRFVSGEEFMATLRATPLSDDSWSEELRQDRAAFDAALDRRAGA
jgi:antitoxin (DNA-binding transcriptional repressor) of toxin-antitoxin stability system